MHLKDVPDSTPVRLSLLRGSCVGQPDFPSFEEIEGFAAIFSPNLITSL